MRRLIINADDFGLFDCVSEGILDCIAAGAVTATGVMTNGARFTALAPRLRAQSRADIGVHLNLSYGSPLAPQMASALSHWHGRFRGKGRMTMAVLSGAISPKSVEAEWRWQIDAALQAGLTLCFLNSHEHLHQLPPLRRIVVRLAGEYGIPHIRTLSTDLGASRTSASFARNALIRAIQAIGPAIPQHLRSNTIGLAASGRLDRHALRTLFSHLPATGTFELMCHPGRFDRHEISDPSLRAYHRWEQERDLLCSDAFRELCDEFSLHIVRFDAASTPPPATEQELS